MYIGNLVLVILNLPLVGIFVNLLRVPFRILFPIILLICLVGTYSVNSSLFELGVLLSFGVVGYVFRELKFDLPPFILAMILGAPMEVAFRQSLLRSGGSFSIFWESPIALTLIVVAILLFLWNLFRSLKLIMVSWMKPLEEG